ncbi:hypothetical protein B1T44_29740 [Mycobacterium persicum]|nr:hypothetical protein B1T44_29740 [Mycobacterium persicum]
MASPPSWLARVRDCDRHADDLRRALTPIADERARIIAEAVASYGRGGRERVAAELGVTVGQVDVALKRARTHPRLGGLPWPGELLESIYRLELAELPPLPADLWHYLADVFAGTGIDATWVYEPGQLIAYEVEDDEDDFTGLVPELAASVAAAARSWTRIQALAVLDAIFRADMDALPTSADGD